MTFEQLKALAAEALQIVDKESDDDDETMGSGLLKLLELMPTRLEQFGRYAEWRRGFDRYMEKTRPYLDGLTDGDLHRLVEATYLVGPYEHTKYERNQYSCSWDIEDRHARAHVLTKYLR